MCKLRPLHERFPIEFREWVNNLVRLHLWHKAGYPLEKEPLDFEAWQALAVIARYHEVKDIEAQMQAMRPA